MIFLSATEFDYASRIERYPRRTIYIGFRCVLAVSIIHYIPASYCLETYFPVDFKLSLLDSRACAAQLMNEPS